MSPKKNVMKHTMPVSKVFLPFIHGMLTSTMSYQTTDHRLDIHKLLFDD